MKKFVLVLLALLTLSLTAMAKPVDSGTARKAASTFLKGVGGSTFTNLTDVTSQSPFKEFYIFSLNQGKGFILVSADDCVMPILGYSLSNTFVTEQIPAHVKDWMQMYDEQIAFYREHYGNQEFGGSPDVRKQWDGLLNGQMPDPPLLTSVNALVTTTWNQSPYYNDLCPYDNTYSTKTVTGCVATATAQVMKFWNHPTTGYGSHSYTHNTYGTQSADFGATTYDWNNMPTSLSSNSSATQINAVATLMHHIGVAVEMDYGPSATGGSGAATGAGGDLSQAAADNALLTYFKYKPTLHFELKENYTDAQWCTMLQNELDAGRPMVYKGRDYSGGHAFVCDGYNNQGQFHFNWGWGGSYDGFYTMGDLHPGTGGTGGNSTYTFNLANGAIMGIEPIINWDTTASTSVSVSSSQSNNGSVAGSGSYSFGDTITLRANANTGCRLNQWSDGSMQNPRQLIARGGSINLSADIVPLSGDTLGYCFSGRQSSLGNGSGANYWGIKMPGSVVTSGHKLTAVQFYVSDTGTYDVTIYTGSSSPSNALYTQSFAVSDEDCWTTLTLTTPVTIPADQNFWITLHDNGVAYPASYSSSCGNSDGALWGSSFSAIYPSWDVTFMIRGIFAESTDTNVTTENTLTVNNGTTTNGYVPIYGYYCDDYTQSTFIIPADSLTAMQYGTINKLTFYSSNANVDWGTAQFEVYLTETNATTVSGIANFSNMTQVKTAGVLSINNNIMEVTLTSPYLYMGGNLMIAFNQPTSGTYVDCNWYGVTAIGASYGGYSDDLSQQNFLPKTTFTYTPGQAPSCYPVMGLTASHVTANSAILNWTDTNNTGATYSIYRNDTLIATGFTGTTYTVTGLTVEYNNTLGVVANCSSTDASVASNVSVYTGYCSPNPSSRDGQGITGVAFGGMTNTTSHPTAAPFYGNYSNLSGSVPAGTTATVDITYATGYDYGTIIWVDWNNNLTFDSNEVVYVGVAPNTNPTTLTATFDIPSTQTPGNYRMRIVGADSHFDDYTGSIAAAADANPCDSYTWGVAEDYTLTVTEYVCWPMPIVIGNENSTTTANGYPVNNYYRYTLTETIIDEAEIGGAMPIMGIKYYFNYATAMTAKTNCTIWLQPTTKTVFSSSSDLELLDTTTAVMVYTGDLNCSQGWNTFTFDTPFQYNGTGNLMVIVDDNSYNYNTSSHVFRTSACTGYKSLQWYSDSNNPDPTNSSYSGTKTYVQSRVVMALVTCDTASCHTPLTAEATTVGANTATLTWTSSEAASYSVTLMSGTSVVSYNTTTDTTMALTGLTANSDYSVVIRALCSSTDSSSAVSTAFHTECDLLATLPYTYGFEGATTGSSSNAIFTAECWKRLNNCTGSYQYPYVSSSYCHAGTRSLYWYSTTSSSATYGTHQIAVLPGVGGNYDMSGLRLKFWSKVSTATYRPVFYVGVMTDPTDYTTFVPTDTIAVNTEGNTNYAEYNAYLTNYNGNGRYVAIAAQRPATSSWYAYMDDITLEELPSCVEVVSVDATNITTNGAVLTWVDNFNTNATYTVSNAQGVIASNITGNSYTVTGLTPGTQYTFYVTVNCSATESTQPVSVTFYTACAVLTANDLPYSETFESYGSGSSYSISPCWTKGTNNSTAYPYPTSTVVSGTRSLYFYGYKPSSSTSTSYYSYAALPQLDAAVDISDLTVNFKAKRYSSTGVTYRSIIYVGVMTNPTVVSSFVAVDTINMTPLAASAIESYSVNLANYAGTGKYVAFYCPAVDTSTSYSYNYIYIDDVVLDFTPSCLPVTNLVASNVTSNSATLTWTDAENTNATYTVYNGSTAVATGITGTTYTVTGLSSLTDYTFGVVANCSATDASAMTTVAAQTACAPLTAASMPFVENFDNYTSSTTSATGVQVPCWTLAHMDVTMTDAQKPQIYYSSTASYNHSGNYTLRLYYNGIYAMREIDTNISALRMNFWVRQTAATYQLIVGVMSDLNDATTFVPVDTINNGSNTSTMVEHTVYFNNYSGNGRYIAFRNFCTTSGTNYSYNYIDDVTVEFIPSCMDVANLTASNITTNSVTLNWTDTENSGATYTVYNGIAAVASGITGTTYTVTGLTSNTDYTLGVVANCSATDASPIVNITTRTECDLMTTLPYTYGFEGTTTGTSTSPVFGPECWHRLNNGTQYMGYPYINSTYHTGTRSAYWYSSTSTSANYGTYQAIVLPGVGGNYVMNNLRLTFWAKCATATYRPVFYVGVMADPTDYTTFVPTDTIYVNTEGNTNWDEYIAYLTNYNGNGRYVAIAAQRPATSAWYAYTDDFTLEELPSCFEVTNLSATKTNNSITLSWADNLNTSATYTVSDAQGVTIASGLTTMTYTVTGLTANTSYTYNVTANCSATDSSAATSITVTTDCDAETFPFTEDFSASINSNVCWRGATGISAAQVFAGTPLTLTTPQWSYTSSAKDGLAAGHYYKNVYGNSTSQLCWMITPNIDLSNAATAQLEFDVALTDYNNSALPDANGDTNTSQAFMVIISTDGGNTWSANNATIWQNASQTDTGEFSYASLASTTYQHKVINLSQYVGGTVKIAFYTQSLWSGGDNDLHIDNIAVTGDTVTPECWPMPIVIGNESSTTTTYNYPVNNYYRYTLSETIIDEAEIGGAMPIMGLKYYFNYATAMTAKTNCTIWLQPTTKTVFSSSSDLELLDSTTAVMVYTGDLNCSQGWNTFTFDTPYQYNGTGNLMVIVDDNSYSYNSNSHLFRTASCTGNKTLYWYSDSNNPDPSNSSFSGSKGYAQYRVVMALVTCDTTSCHTPLTAEATTVGANTATVAWTSSNAASYSVTLMSGTSVVSYNTTTDTTMALTGLTANSDYSVVIRALCSSTDSSDAISTAFHTECDLLATLPYTYGFEGATTGSTSNAIFTAECWKRLNNCTGSYQYPYVSSSYCHAGTRSLYWYSTTSSSATYGTHQIAVLPGVGGNYDMSGLRLKFWSKVSTASYRPVFYVGVMTDPNDYTTFVPTDTIAVNTDGNTNYAEYTAYLTGYNGNGRYVAIAAQRPASATWYAYMDDITLEEAPSCINPTITDVTYAPYNNGDGDYQATVTWSATGTSYQIGLIESAQTSIINIWTNSHSFVISPEVASYVKIRAICGVGDTSEWSDSVRLYYGYCAPNPTSVDNSGITNVTFGTGSEIVNNSQRPTTAPYYGDYRNLIGAIPAGTTANVDITYATGYDYGTIIWVDWNKNYAFDGDEVVYVGVAPATNPTTLNATFNIPTTQDTGLYRMRIAGADSYFDSYTGSIAAAVNANPCFTSSYAVAHDYSLHVTEAPACLSVTNLVASEVTDSSVTLMWTNANSTGATYTVYNGSTAVATGITDTTYTIYGLNPLTDYTFGITANCSATAASTMTTLTVRTLAAPILCDGEAPLTFVNAESITGTTQYFPAYSYYNYSYSEVIVPSTQLTGLGEIKGMEFHVNTIAAGSSYFNNCEVYLMNTSATSLSNGFIQDAANFQLVYSGDLNQTDTGWYLITFANTFQYDGVSNLLVAVRRNHGAYQTSGTFGAYTATESLARYIYQDDGAYTIGSITGGTATTTVPVYHFLGCEGEVPSCMPVTNLTATNVTFTSATLTWADTNNTGATYTVYNDTTVVVSGITDMTYTVTGLTAESNNTLRVEANCSTTASSIPVSVNVYTGYCSPNPTSRDGQGITSVAFGNLTNASTHPTAAPYYGNYSNMVGAVPAGTTATVDITYATGYTYGTIIWVDWNNSMSFDSNEVVYVGESSDNSPTTLTATFAIPATQATGLYRMRIVGADSYFDSYTGSIAAAANADPCASYTWGVAEDYTLYVTEAPSCLPVTGITVSDIENISATISWDSTNAVSYEVELTVNATTTTSTTSLTSIQLSQLTPATVYNVRVRAICGAGDTSTWSDTVTFNTAICPSTEQCPITVVMKDSYGDGWNGGALIIYDSLTNIAVATLSAQPGPNPGGDEPGGDEPGSDTIDNSTSDTLLVNLCRDRGYWVSYTSGEYDSEASFTIFASNGDTIANVSAPNAGYQAAFTHSCSNVNPDTNVTDECWPLPIVIGNENSTTTANSSPVHNYYKYSLSETIIDEAEIGGAMPINGIRYYYNYASAMTKKTNCTIWLQPTTKTAFSSNSDIEPLDSTTAVMVYSGALDCSEGWSEFTFTTPYNYSGTGNLMVIVDDNSNNYDGNVYHFRTSACTGYKTLVWYSDTYDADPTSSTYSGSKTYLQTRVVMALMTCDTATCHQPLQASATAGIHNASVVWASSNATTYSVTLSNNTGIVSYNTTTDTTYAFTGLLDNTDYSVAIRALCSSSDSSAALTTTFRTECDLMTTLPYTYDFEDATTGSTTSPVFDAECWKHLNNGTSYMGYPYIASSTTYNHTTSGTKGLYWYMNTTTGTYGDYEAVVLPGVNTTTYPINTLRLRFWAKASAATARDFIVGVMSDPTDINTFLPADTVNVNSTDWVQYTVNLTNYNGNGAYVAIRQNRGTATFTTYMDDIALEVQPSCVEVTNLAATNITNNSVTLSWTDQQNSGATYTVSNATSVIASGLATMSYTATGLTSNTDYTFNVTANCSATDASYPVSINVHTECDLMTTLPYTYGFEGAATGGSSNPVFDGECWKRLNNGTQYFGYPYISSTTSYCHTGSRCVYWYCGTTTAYGDYQCLVLPGVGGNLEMNRLHLKFWAKASSTSYHPVFYVGVMSDPTDISTFVYVDTINVEGTTYTEYESYTAAYTGTGRYVAIRSNRGTSAWTAYFDDVTLEEVSGCAFVTNLSIAGVTDNSVTLSWTDNMNNVATYTVSNASGIIASGITGTSYTVTGLTANTDYTFYVTANCSATEVSDPVSINAHTECAMLTSLPFTYGFEGATTGGSSSTTFVDCWHRLNNAGTYFGWPYVGSTSSYCHTGNRGLYWYLATTTGTYGDYECIVMPGVGSNYDMSDLQLRFWARATSATYHPVFYVGVMTNPSDINSFVYVDTINVEGTTYTEYTAYLANYTGNGRYVAIRANRPTSIWYATMDDITLEEMPSCLPVTSVTTSNVTPNSATLTWTDNFNTGATYTVSDATGVVATGISGNNYTVTGLNGGTQYTFYVTANCSATDSSESASVTFYTTCVALTAADLPYSEDFESYGTGSAYSISPCWTKGTNGSTAYPYPYATNAITGTRSLYFYGYKPTSATSTSIYSYAALPQLDATVDVSDLTLSFKARRYATTTAYYRSIIYVGVMTDPTAVSTFTAIDTINMTPLAASTVENYHVDLANYAGTGKYVAFYCPFVDTSTSYSYNYIYIDDVVLDVTPTCQPVNGIAVTNVLSNSVTVTWTDTIHPNATYTVYNGTTMVASGITGNTYTFTGLTPSSDYTFGVAANCSATDASPITTVAAHTVCAAVAFPFNEDFSADLSSNVCWRGATNATAAEVFAGTALTLTTPSWSYASSVRDGLAAGHYYKNVYGTNQKTWMITPDIDLTNATTAQLSFDIALTDYNNAALPDANGDTNTSQAFMVIISTNSGNTWSAANATVWQNGTGDYTYASLASTTYQNKVINLNQYVGGTVKIAFYTQSIWSGGDNDLHIDNIAVTVVPNCPAVHDLAVSGLTANSVTLSWADSNNTGASYSVLRNDTLIASNITATTYTATGLAAETNYTFSVVANCSATEASLPVSVSAFTGYCTPTPTSVDGNGITSVAFGSMTNTTSHAGSSAAYVNNTHMSGSVPAGTTATVDITYATGYSYGTIIWVDWNNNLTFDGNEVVYVGESSDNNPTTLTATFNIPATQDTGNYRMRIVGADSYFDNYTGSIAAAANANPCGSYSWGVAEDYTLTVTGAPACLPVTDLTIASITTNSVTLTWTDSLNTGVTYTVLSDTTVLASGLTATTYTVTGLTAETNYTFSVVTNCSATDASLPVSVNAFTGYCLPTPTSVDGSGITSVAFGGMTNTTSHAGSSAAFVNNTHMVGSVPAGTTATVDITYATGYSYGTIIWVDWNNNLTFDGNEVVYVGESSDNSPTTLTATFNIPATQDTGNYRMRIVGADSYFDNYTTSIAAAANANPCASYLYGVAEDYTLHVTEAPNCLTPTNLQMVYIGGSSNAAVVSWTSDANAWNLSLNGVVTYNITANPDTITGLDPNTTYTVMVQANCGNDTSDWTLPVSITTPCATIDMPFVESFDSSSTTRNCWDFVSNNTANIGGTYGMGFVTLNGNTVWRFSSYSSASDYNQYAYSPLFNTPTTGNALRVRVRYATNGSSDHLWFGYRTANDTNYTWTPNYYTTTGQNDFQTLEALLPLNVAQLAIHYYGDYAYYAWIDSVELTPITCPTDTTVVSVLACDSYLWNDNVYTQSGVYPAVLTTANGCDSNVVLNLTINHSAATTDSVTICDSYLWNDSLYTVSTMMTDSLTTTNGCDSIVTVQLTVNHSTSSSDTVSAFNSYVWNGNTYMQSGIYTYTTLNAVGCDSVATLVLTVTMLDTVTLTVNDTTMGSVRGAGVYTDGDTITLYAVANTGYHFTMWSDGDTNAIRTLVVTSNVNLTAYFAINQYTIALAVNDSTMGIVRGAGVYNYGDTAVVTAVANTGYHFVNWSDNDTNALRALVVTDNVNLTANFAVNQYTLTVAANDSTMGSVTGSGVYNYGATATLTATADSGYHFQNWNDGNVENPRTVVVMNDASYTAIFVMDSVPPVQTYTVTLAVNDSTMGSVHGAGVYVSGSQIAISAISNYGYHFTMWSDGDTNNPRTLTVTSDTTLTATFAVNQYTVTLAVNDTLMGSVTGAGVYNYGDTATLTATANAGYHFTLWSDGDTNNPRTLVVNADMSLIAYFAIDPVVPTDSVTFVVTVNDSAMGTTVPAPGTYRFAVGDTASVQAVAATGYHFANWTLTSGNINQTLSTNPLTTVINQMMANQTIVLTANFSVDSVINVDSVTVVLTINDTARGTTNPAPGTYRFAVGDSVYAVATPSTGYRFLGWFVDVAGNTTTVNDNPIRLEVPALAANMTINVTANFVPMGDDTYTVIATPVTTDGDINAGGTITGNGTYPAGSNVTLTAMADEGYRFVGWYNANDTTFDMPLSTEYSYSFIIMENLSLIALFTPESNPTAVITIATADSTMGYVLLNNDTVLRYVGQIGEEVTIEAIAYEGYRFVAWNDGDTNALRTIILDMPVTMLTARFELIPNSIDDAEEAEEIVIYTENDRITVRGAENRPVYVFDVVGRLVAKSAKASAEETFRMTNTGIYMVKVGNAPARRVVVRR